MKVVLKQDVKSIGKKDEMHEVSDGYARNYLMPRGLAVAADAAAVNMVKTKAEATRHHAEEELAAAQTLAAKLAGKTVTLKAKAGQGGRLFGSVTGKDIAAELTKLSGEEVDKRKVVLDADIKAFGSYQIEIKIYPKVTAKVTVCVQE
ncbi:MAG: 50S ribosomal protein L9 [Ruthenibacterium sp.]